jgi:hypothetical protein
VLQIYGPEAFAELREEEEENAQESADSIMNNATDAAADDGKKKKKSHFPSFGKKSSSKEKEDANTSSAAKDGKDANSGSPKNAGTAPGGNGGNKKSDPNAPEAAFAINTEGLNPSKKPVDDHPRKTLQAPYAPGLRLFVKFALHSIGQMQKFVQYQSEFLIL